MSIEAAQQNNAQCGCKCHRKNMAILYGTKTKCADCHCITDLTEWNSQPIKFTSLKSDIEILQERIEKLEKELQNFANEELAKEVASLNEGYGSLFVRVESLESQLSLKEAIENTVLPKTFDMTFGEAIEAMKRGCKVGCWHRDDIYVYLVTDDGSNGAHFKVKTVDGFIYPWFPNQREMLGENWRIIND